jgi:hypothetical protein
VEDAVGRKNADLQEKDADLSAFSCLLDIALSWLNSQLYIIFIKK